MNLSGFNMVDMDVKRVAGYTRKRPKTYRTNNICVSAHLRKVAMLVHVACAAECDTVAACIPQVRRDRFHSNAPS